MGKFIELEAADGFAFPAYVAEPPGTCKAAVVVLQEIYGVNSHIQQVAEGFAARGYLAVAPAMFERVEQGVDLGYSQATLVKGKALKEAALALPGAGIMQDVQAAVDHAARTSGGKVGLVGFCFGGLLSWQASDLLHGLSASVPYYGGGMVAPEEIVRKPKVPVMAHLSDHDHFVPMEGVKALVEAHPRIEVHIYKADHGFNCDQRGAYNQEAAKLARERTLDFFAKHLA